MELCSIYRRYHALITTFPLKPPYEVERSELQTE